jgi:hypothetical protein
MVFSFHLFKKQHRLNDILADSSKEMETVPFGYEAPSVPGCNVVRQ